MTLRERTDLPGWAEIQRSYPSAVALELVVVPCGERTDGPLPGRACHLLTNTVNAHAFADRHAGTLLYLGSDLDPAAPFARHNFAFRPEGWEDVYHRTDFAPLWPARG